MFFLKKLMITPSELRIFIFIKRFILRLSITYMSLINLIIIDFFFDVFSFMKKENEIHFLMKCRLKSISHKMIVDSCFFIIREEMNRFKNTLLFIFINHFVLRQSDSERAFLKKLKSSIK